MSIRFNDPSITRLTASELTNDLVVPVEGHSDGETHNTALQDILQFADTLGTAQEAATEAIATHTAEPNPHPQYATDTDLSGAFTAHNAAADPHPQYATDTALTDAIATHNAAANPHPQYATDTDLSGAFTAHNAASDPHPQYATDTALTGAIAAHSAEANPHPQYATDTDLSGAMSAHNAAADPHPQYATDTALTDAITAHNAATDPHPQYTTDAEVSTAVSGAVSTHAATRGTGAHIPDAGITDTQVASVSATKIQVAADSPSNLAAGTLQATLASQSQSIFQLNQVQISNQFPQVIANGRFWINQRGGGSYTVPPGATGLTLDRWKAWNAMATGILGVSQNTTIIPTVAQSGIFQSASYAVNVNTGQASLAAGETAMIFQAIEGHQFQFIAQRPLTLSFWVRSSVVGTYCVALQNVDSTQSFVAEYVINAANTWERKEVSILATPSGGAWNYSTGVGLYVEWILASGSTYHTTPGSWVAGNRFASNKQVNFCATTNNKFYLANVQISAGFPTLTPSRNHDLLLNCYPHYSRISLSALATATVANQQIEEFVTIPYPMRITPTLSLVTAGQRVNLAAASPPVALITSTSIRYLIVGDAPGLAYSIDDVWALSADL